jgi:hypothetical protein
MSNDNTRKVLIVLALGGSVLAALTAVTLPAIGASARAAGLT